MGISRRASLVATAVAQLWVGSTGRDVTEMSYWVNVREVKRFFWHAFAHFWEVTFAESPVLPQGEGGESEVCAADVNRRWGG